MFFFLYGQDNFRSLERLNQLKADFIKNCDQQAQNIFILESEEFNVNQLKTQLASTGLFSQNKMIIVQNLISQVIKEGLAEPENILKILNKPLDDNITLIFYEAIAPDKRSKLFKKLVLISRQKNQAGNQEYNLLPPWQVKQWVNNYLKNFNFKIENQALDYLTAVCGADLWHLKNEADKLMVAQQVLPSPAISFSAGNDIGDNQASKRSPPGSQTSTARWLDLNLIKQIITAKIDDNIFHLTDALSVKNTNQAIDLLEQQLAVGADPFYLFSMLVRQFRILLKIKDGESKYQPAQLASQIGEHPFVVSKGLKQVQNFSQQELADIYQKLLDMDLKIKTSSLDIKVILTEFVWLI